MTELRMITFRLPSLSAKMPPGSWKRNCDRVSTVNSIPRSSFVAFNSRMKRLRYGHQSQAMNMERV